MQFVLLRRVGAHQAESPATTVALAAYADAMDAAGILRVFEHLLPGTHSVHLMLGDGPDRVAAGLFPDSGEPIAAFVVIDVPDRQTARAWLRRWPDADAGATVELRESGCPGGSLDIAPPADGADNGKRFAILLRSDRALEDEHLVSQDRLDTLNAFNAVESGKGILLAGDGLRSSALGARLGAGAAAGKRSLVDGPFTEIKELIAGYWLVRLASLDAAIAWARRTPYPSGAPVQVEIRELAAAPVADKAGAAFTPAQRAAEQRMRARQLESGMQDQLAAPAPAWR